MKVILVILLILGVLFPISSGLQCYMCNSCDTVTKDQLFNCTARPSDTEAAAVCAKQLTKDKIINRLCTQESESIKVGCHDVEGGKTCFCKDKDGCNGSPGLTPVTLMTSILFAVFSFYF